MIGEKQFKLEVEKLLNKIKNEKLNLVIEDKLDRAYTLYNLLYKNSSETIDREEAHQLVKDILEYLFKDKFSNRYSVPSDFIESAIGNILFSLKFGLAEPIYGTSEIATIMCSSRALVSHDIRHNENVRASRKGRIIIMYERDLLSYMQIKGMTKDEARKRLSHYLELKSKGISNDKIKEKLESLDFRI